MEIDSIEVYGGEKFADIFERAKKVAASCGGSYTFGFNGVSVTVTADSDYQTTWQEYLRAYDEGGVGMTEFYVGDRVKKITGRYKFVGVVVAAFCNLSGDKRYVVENADGVLHIFGPQNLARVEGDDG